MRRGALVLLLALLLAGCGARSAAKTPKVCRVYPAADGRSLVYRPAGCQRDLKHEILDIETTQAP